MTTPNIIRCLRCGQERPRRVNTWAYCEECEQALREAYCPPEATDLRKTGVVAHKDLITGDLQIDINTWSDSSDWRGQLFEAIRKLKHIGALTIRNREYVEDLLTCIEDHSALKVLRLGGTGLTDQGLKRIQMLNALKVLDLSRTQITDGGLLCLAGLASLSHLGLSETRITARGLANLGAVPTLQVLDLRCATVDDTASLLLEQMPALRRLILTGALMTPSAIKSLACRRPHLAVDWSPTLRLIGYWSDDRKAAKRAYGPWPGKQIKGRTGLALDKSTDEDDPFIHPRRVVDPSWEKADRPRIVYYLSTAREVAHGGGVSYCRFGCGTNGSSEQSDGVWLWPEGLAHYVDCHDVRLPGEFVLHMRDREYNPSPVEEPIDFFRQSSAFWHSWCASEKH
jgi:hypothetical protein